MVEFQDWKRRVVMAAAAGQRATMEPLERRALFSVTAAPAYLLPEAPGVEITPLLTVGDAVRETGSSSFAPTYRMVGIPDGLGAYDNGDGTFTVLMNHELRTDAGVVRDHGATGSFVSKYIIDKSSKNVISGDDLIKSVMTYDPASGQYLSSVTAFNRFCSANLPEAGAYFNPATGRGATERIFNNGEESSGGRAWAHIVTGAEAGTSYELPGLGKYAFENVQASPFAQDKTIVAGLDDSSRSFTAEDPTVSPSEVYFYIGNKQSTGNVIDRAGLTGGILTGLKVGVPGVYDANELSVANGDRFELADLGDASNKTAKEIQADSIAAGVTQFRRVEDGHWDPNNPGNFYFTTTDRFNGTTRVWHLRFDDITNPQTGGTIQVYIDSPPGVSGEMFDNLTVDERGDLLVQEDPGNQPYVARIWKRGPASANLVEVARHNPELFDPNLHGEGAAGPSFITQDEESSGIIDVSHLFGDGWYLADVQAHYDINAADPHGFANADELVEGGQLLLINTGVTRGTFSGTLSGSTLTIRGTVNDDTIYLERKGSNLQLFANGRKVGQFGSQAVDTIVIDAGAGSDDVYVNTNVPQKTILKGGQGDDLLRGGGGRTILIGGEGTDLLRGATRDNIYIGGTTSISDDNLHLAISRWAGPGAYRSRINAVRPLLTGRIGNDFAVDRLEGNHGTDWFFKAISPADKLINVRSSEQIN